MISAHPSRHTPKHGIECQRPRAIQDNTSPRFFATRVLLTAQISADAAWVDTPAEHLSAATRRRRGSAHAHADAWQQSDADSSWLPPTATVIPVPSSRTKEIVIPPQQLSLCSRAPHTRRMPGYVCVAQILSHAPSFPDRAPSAPRHTSRSSTSPPIMR